MSRKLSESSSLLLFSNKVVLIDSHILKGKIILWVLFVDFNILFTGYVKNKIYM